jgi:hypothetical protein
MDTKKLYPLLGLPLIAFNISVMAQDGKAYPGALCQPETNTESILRNNKGMMFNTGTEPQTWICPIVRDRIGSLEEAIIRVQDNNGDLNADISCTFFSRKPKGQLVASETQKTTGTTGVINLMYGGGTPDTDINSHPKGYYYFRCTIPGTFGGLRSGVVEYLVSEKGNT